MSFVIWFIVTMYLSNLAGAYQVFIFAFLQILCVIGFIYEVILIMENQPMDGGHLTFVEAARFALTNNLLPNQQENKTVSLESDKDKDSISEEESDIPAHSDENIKRSASIANVEQITKAPRFGKKSMSMDADVDLSSTNMPIRKIRTTSNVNSVSRVTLRERYLLSKLKAELRMSLDIQDDKVDTDKYMYGAFYACIGMLLWKHRWVMHILVIPLVYYIVKQLGSYFGFWESIRKQYESTMETIKSWCNERHQALLPSNIRGLYKIAVITDEKLRNILKGSVDAVATTAVIFGLIVFTTSASIFITIQVQQIFANLYFV